MATLPRNCFCCSQHPFSSTERNNNLCESPQIHSPGIPRHVSCVDGPNSCSCLFHNNVARSVPECIREPYCCSIRTHTRPSMEFGADFVVHPKPVPLLKQCFEQPKQHIENLPASMEFSPNTGLPNQITLSNWYLIKCGEEVSVGGFISGTSGNQRLKTAAISERIEKCRLLAKDGVEVQLMGLIDDDTTINNGFSMKIVYSFLSGFPYTWNHLLNIKIASHASACPVFNHNKAHVYSSVGKDKEQFVSPRMDHGDDDSHRGDGQSELGNAMNRDNNADKTHGQALEDVCEDPHKNVAEGELEHLNNAEQTTGKVTQQVELSSRTRRLMQRLARHLEGTVQQNSPAKASELNKDVKKALKGTPEKMMDHQKTYARQRTKKQTNNAGRIKSQGSFGKKKNWRVNAVNETRNTWNKHIIKNKKQSTTANELPNAKPSPSSILPPLPRPRVLVSKRLISAAFGLKFSSSGRLLVPPLAHWCNQIPLRDKDGGIIAIADGSTDLSNTSTGNTKFTPPSGENLKKLRKRLCEVAVETPKKKIATAKK